MIAPVVVVAAPIVTEPAVPPKMAVCEAENVTACVGSVPSLTPADNSSQNALVTFQIPVPPRPAAVPLMSH